MMTISEKVAYIKGLMEGMKLDESKDEIKLTQKIVEVLEDMALTVSDLEDSLDIVGEQVDAVDEDLDALESYVYDDDECDDDCCCDDDVYEVKCPKCGAYRLPHRLCKSCMTYNGREFGKAEAAETKAN